MGPRSSRTPRSMTAPSRGSRCATVTCPRSSSTPRPAPGRMTPVRRWPGSSTGSPLPSGPRLPKRRDIHSVAVIGSGPIVIGQACEFDYSGSQALRVLRAEGMRTVLVNSNPATIMTDAVWADRTYLEPLDVAGAESVLRRERPDALLPTLGGQSALHEAGSLGELAIELIGASYDAIQRAEDRELFAATMASVGLRLSTSVIATS